MRAGDRGPIVLHGLADLGRRLTQPDVRRVVCVHRVPPQGFLEWHGGVGRFHDTDRDDAAQLLGETSLDEGHPAGTGDQLRHQPEAVDGDLHAWLDAEHPDLAGGGRVVGALVRHLRQPGQVVEGELVADLGVVDWSARDVQFAEMQVRLGPTKGKDTATTLGPVLVGAGVDGLAHLFADTAHTPEIVDRIASANVFVVPTLTPLASIVGLSHSTDLAQDPRVAGKLSPELRAHLSDTFGGLPASHFDMALATIAALRQAGVDVIAGTDAAALAVRGVTHGASLHGELQLLVQAGFSPAEALRSATSLTARRFGLHDRGRVEQGLRADLVLVDGDPTTTINDSLSIRAVWRQGTRLTAASTLGSR